MYVYINKIVLLQKKSIQLKYKQNKLVQDFLCVIHMEYLEDNTPLGSTYPQIKILLFLRG